MSFFHAERESSKRTALPECKLNVTPIVDDRIVLLEGIVCSTSGIATLIEARQEAPFEDDARTPDELTTVQRILTRRTFEKTGFKGAEVRGNYQGDGYLKEYAISYKRKNQPPMWVRLSISPFSEDIQATSYQGMRGGVDEGRNYVIKDSQGRNGYHFNTVLTPDMAILTAQFANWRNDKVQFLFPRNIGPTQKYVDDILSKDWMKHVLLIGGTKPRYKVLPH